FLCSPPKMVFAFRPDSFATLTKLTPKAAGGVRGGVSFWFCARARRGRASEKTPSRERTSAERLSDWRKARREEDNRLVPASIGLVLEFATTFMVPQQEFRRLTGQACDVLTAPDSSGPTRRSLPLSPSS